MSKGGKRSRSTRATSPSTLDHTVDRASRRPYGRSTPTLMRTALSDTGPMPSIGSVRLPDIKPGIRSPTVVVRASGRSRRIQAKMRSPFLQATMHQVAIPERSFVCARRAIRREVLFARKGLSGSSPKRRRSHVRC